MLHRRCKKILGALTLACFLGHTIASAAPDWSLSPALVAPDGLAGNLGIPAAWGEARTPVFAPSSGKIIFHLQNAHGNYQAQRRIYKILKLLHLRYGVRDLFLEGAAGPVEPAVMRFFPETGLNLKVADLLMRQGEFTGGEFFLLTEGSGQGLEDAALYRKNFDLFLKAKAGEKAAQSFVARADRRLRACEGRIFSPELRRFVREWRHFREHPDAVLRFAGILRRFLRRHVGLDPADPRHQEAYGTIARVLRLRDLAKRLDPAKAKAEKRALAGFLRGRIDPALSAGLESFGDRRSGSGNPRFLLEKIAEQASASGLDFRRYPHFTLFAESVIFEAEIRSEEFFAEAEAASEKILAALAAAPAERKSLALLVELDALKRLFSLRLSREEFEELERMGEAAGPAAWLARLSRLESGALIDSRRRSGSGHRAAERQFHTSRSFYDAACEREKHFLANLLSGMNRKGLRAAVMITGGFHEKGMKELFRREGVSYVSIVPRFRKARAGEEAYWRSLAGENRLFSSAHLEKALRELPAGTRKAMLGPELVRKDRVLDRAAASLVRAASLGAKERDLEFAEFLRRKIRDEKEYLRSSRLELDAFPAGIFPPDGAEPVWITEEDPEERARQVEAFRKAPEIEKELRRALDQKVRFAGVRPDPGHGSEPELLVRRLEDVEKTVVLRHLLRTRGNVRQAVAAIGFTSATVYRKLRSYGLEDGQAHQVSEVSARLGAEPYAGMEKITGSYEEEEKAEIFWALWLHDGDIKQAARVLGMDPRQGFTRGLGKKLVEWGIAVRGDAEEERLKQVRDGMIRNLMAKREQWGAVFQGETREDLARRTAALKAVLAGRPASFETVAYAIALYAEAARRTLADRTLDPQIVSYVGGEPRERQLEAALLLLSNRTTVRMLPSEGKTLTVGLAAFLKAVSGRRVEVHDWSKLLSARDAQVEGAILHQLGMKTAAVVGKQAFEFAPKGRLYPHLKLIPGKNVMQVMQSVFRDYDVVYGPYHEMIFLWMDDWSSVNGDKMHPGDSPEAVIVEEGDTPLLDNLNKPLAFFKELYRLGELPDLIYQIIFGYARTLIDEQGSGRALYETTSRKVTLFRNRREGLLRILRAKLAVVEGALEYLEGLDLLDLVHAALEAQLVLHEKKHYLVKREPYAAHKGRILLINENTGEISEDERLSRGLHSFLEIKHGLLIQKEGNIHLVMTPYEFYSRIRNFSAVMGFLAEADEARLEQLYGLRVRIIEPFHANRRIDVETQYFRTEEEKFRAIAETAVRVHQRTGRPILINARQPFGAEQIAEKLSGLGVLPSDSLRVIDGQNPKNNIRDWGRMGDASSVTVSAQMASRGQEIKLIASLYEDPVAVAINGQTVPMAGLFVIGSHRANSERVEEQLRTRTARRGRPGVTWTVDHLEDNRYLEDYVPDELAEFLSDPRRDFDGDRARKVEIPLLFELQRLRYLRQLNQELAATGPLFKALVEAQFRYTAIVRKLSSQGRKVPAPNTFTAFINSAYYAISTGNRGVFNAVLQDFNGRMIEMASQIEGEAAPVSQSLGEEARNPEFVLRIARPHEEGGVTEGFVFIPDSEARRWALEELGILRASRPETGGAFRAFRRGALDREIERRLGASGSDANERNMALVLFPGVLKRPGRLAEKLQPGDTLVVIRRSQSGLLDPLIRAAIRLGARVKTLPDALVSGPRIASLVPAEAGLPVIVSPAEETRDLSPGFRGTKIKFDEEGLQGRVDKTAVIGLLRKIGDDTGKLRRLGLEWKDGYWEVGRAFADFIETVYRESRAARLRDAAA